MSDLEARSRLTSILDICRHERQRLEELDDPRLEGALSLAVECEAAIAATLERLEPLGSDN